MVGSMLRSPVPRELADLQIDIVFDVFIPKHLII